MARLRIKEVAEAKGIRQSHLQMDARVTPPLLSRYWNNKTSTIDINELEKIARALGVAPGELIAAEDDGGAQDGTEPEKTAAEETVA